MQASCIQYTSDCMNVCMYASKMYKRIYCMERVRALEPQGLSAYDNVTCACRYLHKHTTIHTPHPFPTNNPQTQSHQHLCTHTTHFIHLYTTTPNIHHLIHPTNYQCKQLEITNPYHTCNLHVKR